MTREELMALMIGGMYRVDPEGLCRALGGAGLKPVWIVACSSGSDVAQELPVGIKRIRRLLKQCGPTSPDGEIEYDEAKSLGVDMEDLRELSFEHIGHTFSYRDELYILLGYQEESPPEGVNIHPYAILLAIRAKALTE